MRKVFLFHRVTNEDEAAFAELLRVWADWQKKNAGQGVEWWLGLSFGEEVSGGTRTAMSHMVDTVNGAVAFPHILAVTDERALFAVFGKASEWLEDQQSRPEEIFFMPVTADSFAAVETLKGQVSTFQSYSVVHKRYQDLRDSGGFKAAAAREAETVAAARVQPRSA